MAEVTRMCRVCRQRHLQAEMQRWTLGPGGYVADQATRKPGRGYYTDSDECAKRLQVRGKR